MNCTNCGAALELSESRRFLICRYCGSFNFPDAIDADGVRVIGSTAASPSCPVCSQPMAAAVIDDHPVQFCRRCRGMLLPRAAFAAVVTKRRAWASTPPVEPRPLDRSALERRLACPSCRQPLETYPHYGPGNVVIDNCSGCDLIWLDFGEIRQIVDAPGRDRGSSHAPPLDDEYVRRGSSAGEEDPEPQDLFGLILDILNR